MPSSPPISAPDLILALIDSAANPALSSRYLVTAGELLGIDASAIRVALTRLTKKGVLEQKQRGVYGIGASGAALHTTVRQWHDAERALIPWRGGWLSVHLDHLPRGKTAQRHRERALGIEGYVRTPQGLWLRPANFAGGAATAHRRLVAYGLEEDALLAEVSAFEPPGALDVATLWDTRSLERGYQDHLKRLEASSARLPTLDGDDAARETLLVGRHVTRAILTDPLLPDELVNADLRRDVIGAMRQYDRLGKRCWAAFYAAHR